MSYYTPPHYDFQRPPELDGSGSLHPVVIVGAGPVGLACALELAVHGVPSIVIDPKDSVSDGSRAVCLSRRSMEILQHLGAVQPFTDKALPWTRGRSFFRDTLVYLLEMPHTADERYMPMHNLQQPYMEEYLVERINTEALIELRWQSELTGIKQSPDEVELTVTTPQGEYRTRASYVVAADGARSAARTALDLKLNGDAYEGRYVICDIQMRSDAPTERRAFFDPPANPGATLLVHRQPNDIWRLDYQLRDDENAEAALADEAIRPRIQAILDMIKEPAPWTLEWKSLYKAYTLALDDYRHRRVFFAGDAAHLVPIFGVRGVNSGFADANNLGWKLAYVQRGWAPDALLDSYSPERRDATMEIFREAGKSTKFMTPPTRGYELMRDAALSLSLNNEFARGFVNPRQSVPYDYTDSPATSFQANDLDFDAGPRAGAPLANVRIREDDFLIDHLGCGFTAIFFNDSGKLSAEDRRLADALAVGDETCTTIVVSQAGSSSKQIHDPSGHLFEAYGAEPGSFYLIRPDGHVSSRWKKLDHAQALHAHAVAMGSASASANESRAKQAGGAANG
jgi:3-(3-hydroxy-phenyl)propionate hydroxylase